MMWEIPFSRKIFFDILFSRKKNFEREISLKDFIFQCISFGIINYLLEIEIFSKKISYWKEICSKVIFFFPKVILRDSTLITYYDCPTTSLRQILIEISFVGDTKITFRNLLTFSTAHCSAGSGVVDLRLGILRQVWLLVFSSSHIFVFW